MLEVIGLCCRHIESSNEKCMHVCVHVSEHGDGILCMVPVCPMVWRGCVCVCVVWDV